MREGTQFTIDPETLGGLGSLIPGPKSKLSPYRYGSSRTLTNTQKDGLQRIGLLDAQGGISAAMHSTMEALAQPKAYARLDILFGGKSIEHLVYLAPSTGKTVSVTITNQGLLINDPPSSNDVIGGLAQFIGESHFSSCEFEADVSIIEALALAALIDLHRKSALRAHMEGAPFEQPSFDVATVSREIGNTRDDLNWLVSVIRRTSGWDDPLSEDDVQTALSNLATSKHLVVNGSQYALNVVLSHMAGRLLAIDKVIVFDAGNENDGGDVGRGEFICLQAGVNDLLYVQHTGPVHFECITPAALLAGLRHAFLDPEGIRNVLQEGRPAAAPATARQSVRCPQCGATCEAAQPFCAQCGTSLSTATPAPSQQQQPPVAETANVCPSCGGQNRPGSVFCSRCGADLRQQVTPPAPPAPTPLPTTPPVTVCRSCGAQNQPDAGFCIECGASLRQQTVLPTSPSAPSSTPSALVCPSCSTPNRLGAGFCTGCGAALR